MSVTTTSGFSDVGARSGSIPPLTPAQNIELMLHVEGIETIRTLRAEFPDIGIIGASGAFEGETPRHSGVRPSRSA